jgi:dTDP-4-dehydrorhamnose reductase
VTLRILLTGAGGQLGLEVQKAAARPGADLTVVPLTRSDLDITDPEAVRHALARQKPDILVNAAAYTNVDRAESEPGLALAVNRDGAENLAAACSQANVPLIHVSTDYVFDGRGTRPYREEDPVSPLNAYGRSKAEGEVRIRARHPEHVILRNAWLYATHGRNFLTTMLRLGRERDTLSVVNDQVGCPTWARDLARAILQIAEALPRTPPLGGPITAPTGGRPPGTASPSPSSSWPRRIRGFGFKKFTPSPPRTTPPRPSGPVPRSWTVHEFTGPSASACPHGARA